jgi:hypothetical protein
MAVDTNSCHVFLIGALLSLCVPTQERIRIPDDKMKYYENLAEMYVGDDVSPDFYGWVFPKYDHVAVGTGTVVNKTAIKQYQQATRDRAKVRTSRGGNECAQKDVRRGTIPHCVKYHLCRLACPSLGWSCMGRHGL